VAAIETAIADARLVRGQRLPSIRDLARSTGLSPATVAAAIRTLRERGVVITRERGATHVSWRPPLARSWPPPAAPSGVRDLASGNPDPALLPGLDRFLKTVPTETALYGGAPVIAELAALAEDEFRGHGIAASRIAVASGAVDGIERALAAWLRPGDRVAVEDPGFPGVIDVVRASALEPVPLELDGRGIRPEGLGRALEAGVAAIVVTPRGQNPTGASLDEERASELRRLLGRYEDVLVIEDDHLGAIAGDPRPTLVGGRRRWLAARSVSKSLGPDIRVAVLAGDDETLTRLEGRQLLGPQWVSHILQRLTAMLWSDQTVRALLSEARQTYAVRRQQLIDKLTVMPFSASDGLNVWIEVPDETYFVRELLDRGWAVAAGAPFRLGSAPAVRITASTLTNEETAQLAADVAEIATPARRTRAA
jgi:DNA-binding transcriptional MocR family regulator